MVHMLENRWYGRTMHKTIASKRITKSHAIVENSLATPVVVREQCSDNTKHNDLPRAVLEQIHVYTNEIPSTA